MSGDYNRQAIRELISAALSANEILDLAHGQFPKIYRNFAPGMEITQLVRSIVDEAERKGRIPDLLAYIQQHNPAQYNNFDSRLGGPEIETQTAETPKAAVSIRLYYNSPHPEEGNFQGRVKELEALNKWLADDEAHSIFALVALGGTGKSALAWRWLSDLREKKDASITAIIWWDFYQPGTSTAEFLTDALAFLGDKPPTNDNQRRQANRLQKILQEQPVLLVMDGAERLLRAYSSMNAAYQGDEEIAVGSEERRYNRDSTDPVMAALFRGLAQLPGGKTLITTRLLPRELEGRDGRLLPGIHRHDLTGLDPASTYHLFRELGITATQTEVKTVAEPLDYHPLTLRLLAGYVADDPEAPNDLRAAAGFDPNVKVVGLQHREHILQQAYNTLPATAQQTLSKLAAFRGSVTWPVIEAVFKENKNIRDDLRLLERRNLLQRTPKSTQSTQSTSGVLYRHQPNQPITNYQLHPIVRRYAYDRLADPAATHSQLVSYFEAVPKPQKVQTLADLAPTIELYHHLARAGQYDEARILFRDRLNKPMYYQLGAYLQRIELMLALFPDGEDNLPRLKREDAQGWTLNGLANSYSLAGRPNSAVPLFEQQIAIREKQGDKKNLAIGLGNVADDQMKIGALAAADANLRRSIALCREIEDRFWEAVGHQERGLLLIYCGDWDGAAAELDTALELAEELKHTQNQGLTWAYRARAALLQGNGQTAENAAQEALRLADMHGLGYPVERDYVQAYWLLGWAALVKDDLPTATQHLDEALRRCRAINLVEFEPAILLAQARLARAKAIGAGLVPALDGGPQPGRPQGSPLQQAYEYIEEARLIAERSGYVLDLADIHNFLAQLALDANDQDTARQHATQAQQYATCDGPPYTYKVALEEAERLLSVLHP